MYRLWLHGLYWLYGSRCPMSPERPLNLITHSLTLRHCISLLYFADGFYEDALLLIEIVSFLVTTLHTFLGARLLTRISVNTNMPDKMWDEITHLWVTVQPLKFGNEQVFSAHVLWWMWSLLHAGILRGRILLKRRLVSWIRQTPHSQKWRVIYIFSIRLIIRVDALRNKCS